MKVVTSLEEWKSIRAALEGQTLGFVPTMGALHDGHRSLVDRSLSENKITVVSIFVNPTQFNDPSDFDKYPKTWEADVKLLESLGTHYLLSPLMASIYPDGYRYSVDEKSFSKLLCGAHRAGHFQGVLTVVMKLLNLVRPARSYFGEKDYQQLELIEGLADAFFLMTEIVACPTIREADGLAMSSRNQRLTAENRERAPLFHRVLSSQTALDEKRRILESNGFVVEYLEELEGRRFGAVRLGEVRLIDNVEI
jgi:pantoate--beta-alanine ligase